MKKTVAFVTAAPGEMSTPAAPLAAAPGEQSTPGLSVALIDDDVVMLSLMKAQFRKLGGTVTTFNGGDVFLSSGGASEPYDIIVVDHLMPDMSGIETIEAIAQIKSSDTLMCLASGEAFPSDEDQLTMDRVGCPFFLKGKTCCTDILSWHDLSSAKSKASAQRPVPADEEMAIRESRRSSMILPSLSSMPVGGSCPDMSRAGITSKWCVCGHSSSPTPRVELTDKHRAMLRKAVMHARCPQALRQMDDEEIARLIGKCTGTDHCKDQVVVTQNAVFPYWCAIITGSVKVSQNSKGQIGVMTPAMWFGDFKAVKAAATVVAAEPCLLVFIDNSDIEIARNASMLQALSQQFKVLQLKELEFVPRKIGEGTFAKVFACLHGNAIYALKCLSKNRSTAQIQNEISVLQSLDHSYVVGLHGVLEDRAHIYLVMDFVPGGCLFDYLLSRQMLPETETQFYIANVVAALSYLHDRNVIFRDLKPENLMLTASGHLKMVDFGFAKQMSDDVQRTFTRCGTQAYAAPEINTRKGHGKPVDLWALGILAYEMLTGRVPLRAQEQPAVWGHPRLGAASNKFDDATNGEWVTFPNEIELSQSAVDFVRELLIPAPTYRLQCEAGDRHVGSHVWLDNFDYKLVQQEMHVPPPVVVSNITNTVPYSDFQKFLIARV